MSFLFYFTNLLQLLIYLFFPFFPDNLYLDSNGIIHNASHGQGSLSGTLSDEEMISAIFSYIERLFSIIKPKKLLFIAIDGVAPRAKMNQQRSRRFRTARDREVAQHEAQLKGEEVPAEVFDSNCITPGTEFMFNLSHWLEYFVSLKMSTDSLWSGVKVIVSGCDTPGEGEHKIMSYIRNLVAQPGYDGTTSHCIYGQVWLFGYSFFHSFNAFFPSRPPCLSYLLGC